MPRTRRPRPARRRWPGAPARVTGHRDAERPRRRTWRVRWWVASCSYRPPRDQALRAEGEHRQEDEVTGQDRPGRVQMCDEGLGQPEDDAAGQGAPQRAETADDDGFEREQQLRRAERAGRRRSAWRTSGRPGRPCRSDGGGDAVDVPGVAAHERGGLGVVGDRRIIRPGPVRERKSWIASDRGEGQDQGQAGRGRRSRDDC